MTDLRFRIYPAATPLSGLLVTLDSQDVELGSGLRVELNGSGSGRIIIHSDHADVTAANFARGNYVLVHDLDLAEDIGGFWLTEGEFRAVSRNEEGGRVLTFGGPGSLHYLSRAVWWNEPFVASGSGVYNGPRDDGLWHWFQDQLGDIFKRFIDEAQDSDRPGDPIPSLTYDFDSSLDSAGDPWESMTDGDYTFAIGTTGTETAAAVMHGGLTVWMRPNLLLQAYQDEVGTDRSSGTFTTNKVRFEKGVNIAADLSHAIHESPRVKRLLVKGESSVPADMVTITDAGAPIDREGFLNYGQATGDVGLTLAGEADVALRAAETTTAKFPHIPGDDEAAGLYTPGWPGGSGHYWLGDTVTLHTGTDAYDFNEVELRVAAITWEMRAAGDWSIEVELGATYYSISEPRIAGVTAPGTAQSCGCCPTGPSGPYEFGGTPSPLIARLYPSNTTAGTPSIDSSWDADNRGSGLAFTPTTTPDAGGGQSTTSNGETVPGNWLMSQYKYVLTGTVVFTGGTFRGQGFGKMRSGLGIGGSLGQSQLVVRLMDSSNALKAVLVAAHEPGSIDSAQWSNEGDGGPNPPSRNQMYPADSQWSGTYGVPMAAATGVSGDYLLIEQGVRCFTYSGASGASILFKNDDPGDLPDNDQTQTTIENTWWEFLGPEGDSFAGDDGPPASSDATGSIGTPGCEFAYSDHRHKWQVAGNTPITDDDDYYTGDTVEEALAEVGPRLLPDGGTDGQVLTKLSATDYDADWEDATGGSGGGSSAPFSGVSLTKSAAQAAATATATAITFDGEDFDTDAYHDNSSNTSRITIPVSGKYLVGGSVEYLAATAATYTFARLRKNGSTYIDGRGRDFPGSGSAGTVAPYFAKVVDLAAGDYIELIAEHNHGSNRDVRASVDGTSFWATRLAGSVGEFVGAHAYHSTTQAITTSTWTSIALDSERFDSHAFHDLATNNSRFTVPTGRGGKYLLTGIIEWEANATGLRFARFYKNNTTVIAHAGPIPADASLNTRIDVVAVVELAVGDYVELQGWHSRGSNLNSVSSADFAPQFTISALALNAPAITVDYVRAYHNAAQSVANTTDETVELNSERWDTAAYHDTTTNNHRLTVPSGKDGLYIIEGNIEWASDNDGTRQLYVMVNGTSIIANIKEQAVQGSTHQQSISTLYYLNAGDFVDMRVRHSAGAAININSAGNASPEFGMVRVLAGAGSLGNWITYTPAWAGSGTAPAIGNGTLTGRYKMLDATTMAFHISLTWGSTTTGGSTNWTFGLPSGVTGAGGISSAVSLWGVDQGTAFFVGHGAVASGASVIANLALFNQTNGGAAGLNAPWAWASTDNLVITGVIEVAS